ncbi:uncharacterized protein LOC127841897 [Dreissena polymorpha]|uniref:uncharacterized protein LOC127841897 n=1 Tax=Dreissena polymorpha TaxID=45954 RepID=UPI0022644859|nr:uncharacterized protein LOC127841897 [Dreissena polymorpha]
MSVPTSPEPREAQKEIPLQTIELDDENPEILTLHSTISSEDTWEIVTDYYNKAVRILENITATCSAVTSKATTHDTQASIECEVPADPMLRTKVNAQATKSDSIVPCELFALNLQPQTHGSSYSRKAYIIT